MTDIASNLDKVIEKLDGMTSEVVPKNYGMDIASKVDHIAKQLDYVQAGGGSGGGGSDIMIVNFSGYNYFNPSAPISVDKTFEEISTHINNGGFAIGRDEEMNTYVLSHYSNGEMETACIVFSMSFYFDGSNMGAQTNYYTCRQFVVYTNKVVSNWYQSNN